MDRVHKKVGKFFETHGAKEITLRVRYRSRLKNEVVSFDVEHVVADKVIRIPASDYPGPNFFVQTKKWPVTDIESLVEQAPYRLTVRPNGLPKVQAGNPLLLPLQWHVPCQVVERVPFPTDAITQGVRIEHFFYHNEDTMVLWQKLLTRLATAHSKAAIAQVLQKF